MREVLLEQRERVAELGFTLSLVRPRLGRDAGARRHMSSDTYLYDLRRHPDLRMLSRWWVPGARTARVCARPALR